MKFQPENQMYKLRVTTGAKKKYNSAKQLADKINEYFEYIDANPRKEQVIINRPYKEAKKVKEPDKNGKMVTKTKYINHTHSFAYKDVPRPYTFEGLCNFLGISTETFKNYQASPDKFEVCTQARLIIDQHQFEGAASGFFKEQIIARKLGLGDKTDLTSDGEKISQVTVFQLPDNNRDK